MINLIVKLGEQVIVVKSSEDIDNVVNNLHSDCVFKCVELDGDDIYVKSSSVLAVKPVTEESK